MPLILIADDEPLVTQLVSHRLNTRGFEVAVVGDGIQAIASARRLRPDLVILDAMMPGLDGFAVLKTLKEAPETAAIPVLMLTARKGEKDVVGALTAGADDYLVKPFIPEELVTRVKRLLGNKARP